MARLRGQRLPRTRSRATAQADLAKIRSRLRQIVHAIAEGVPARTLKDELLGLETREDSLEAKLEATPEQMVLLSPAMAEVYRARRQAS